MKKNAGIGLYVLLVGVPIALALSVPRPKDMRISTRARRLIPFTHAWPMPMAGALPYAWLPDGRAIARSDRGVTRILDPRTGLDGPLTAPSDALSRDPTLRSAVPGRLDWDASPDGRWLLTYTGKPPARWARLGRMAAPVATPPRKPLWVAVRLDGSRIVTRPRIDGDDSACWLPDSSGWTTCPMGAGRIVRYSLDVPGTHSVPIPPGLPFGMPMGIDRAQREVFATWVGNRYTEAVVSTVPPTAQITTYRIPTHPGSDIAEVEISPDGTRLAWLVEYLRTPSLFALFRQSDRVRAELWVSDLDGANMRELATSDDDPLQRSSAPPEWVRWTRDGREVTFEYDRALWSVPAG